MRYQLGFIGSGNMGSALAIAAAKSVNPKEIAVSDHSIKKAEALEENIGAVAVDNAEIVKEAKYIFLGVKPQMLKKLFKEIAPMLAERQDDFILVSMAAGTSISEIHEMAGKEYPVIRIMPNTPVSIGKGIILFATSSDSIDASEFCEMMKESGALDEIPESLIDAASCVTGCSPAWIYMFIEALADGGVKCGLPRYKALNYACNALIGSAELVKKSGKHPGQLKDEVTSPGGTTIAGVHALEKKSFRGTVMDAVSAAYEKTLNLKK